MILILTSKLDSHVGAVTRHLDASGAPWVRINTEDLPRNVVLEIEPACGAGTVKILDSGREFSLSEVSAIWHRKPDPVDLSHFTLEPAECDYVEAEFNEVLHGLYALLRERYWINNPLTTRLAHRKLLQLRTAALSGFAVPRTIVTNIPSRASAFAAKAESLALKSLGALSVTRVDEQKEIHHGLFTRRINAAELDGHIDKVRHMPTQLQEFIPKRAELRITCVGDQYFACRIVVEGNAAAAEDHRFVTKELPHQPIECPAALREPIRRYLDSFGLNFGCFDVAETYSGDYVFFECNPNGQWLWVEELAGLPIGRAVANLLIGDETRLN